MHAGQHDLRMMHRQRACLIDQLGDRPRAVRAARQRRRAKRAVLVAAVLDLQKAAAPCPGAWPRGVPDIDARRREHVDRIRVRHNGPHARQCRDRAVVERGRAPHHDRLRHALARDLPDETFELDFAFVSDGAGVDDGEIGERGIVHRHGAARVERRAHPLGVVLIRLAAERVEVDVHGRTVRPSRSVHTRSVRPVPLRCRRSIPTSSRPRPCENERPRPAEYPTSVGALPMPKGSCPPRAPRRIGDVAGPSSAPPDQLTVSCALGPPVESPVAAVLQPCQAAEPAKMAWVPARHMIPPPYDTGRSFSATVRPRRSARRRESERHHVASRTSVVTSNSALSETPFPPYAISSRDEDVRKLTLSAKLRVAMMRDEPVSMWTPAPSAIQRRGRIAAASRRSVTAPSLVTSSVMAWGVPTPSLVTSSVMAWGVPRKSIVSWVTMPNVRSRYVVNPPAITTLPSRGPPSVMAGNRVPRRVVCVPAASNERHDVPLVTLAVVRRTSASAASMSGENGSNGANAPPAERARTLSHFPGVPRPRIPNWESWAARQLGSATARTSAAIRPRRTAVFMADRTGNASRTSRAATA